MLLLLRVTDMNIIVLPKNVYRIVGKAGTHINMMHNPMYYKVDQNTKNKKKACLSWNIIAT